MGAIYDLLSKFPTFDGSHTPDITVINRCRSVQVFPLSSSFTLHQVVAGNAYYHKSHCDDRLIDKTALKFGISDQVDSTQTKDNADL